MEFLCKSLHSRGIVPDECDVIEHYERDDFIGDTFDLVTIDDSMAPHWDSIDQAEVEALLGCDAQELNARVTWESRLWNALSQNQETPCHL